MFKYVFFLKNSSTRFSVTCKCACCIECPGCCIESCWSDNLSFAVSVFDGQEAASQSNGGCPQVQQLSAELKQVWSVQSCAHPYRPVGD